jgi:hypothetical protein
MMMKGLHVLMNYFFRNFVVEGKILFLMFIMTGTESGLFALERDTLSINTCTP